MSRYIYQRDGRPLLRWGDRAPAQSRGADARALGSLGSTSLAVPTLELPVPGGPEPMPLSGLGSSCGCNAKVSCGCPATPLAGIADTLGGLSTTQKVLGAVGLYFLYKHLKKR
jgi:hypothetical protein